MIEQKFEFNSSSDWPKDIHGIYAIYSKSTNKRYIGMTRHSEGFHGRWEDHRTLLRVNNHDNKYLQNSYNKHGENDFYFKIIEVLTQNDELMGEREWFWVEKLESMYNKNGWNIDKRDYRHKRIANRKAIGSHFKTFQLIDPSGKTITATGINKFARETGIPAPAIINLLNGKTKSYMGYKSTNPDFHVKKIVHKLRSPCGEIVEFNSIRDFCKKYYLSFGCIQPLLKGKIKQSNGWTNINYPITKLLPYLISFGKTDGWFKCGFKLKNVNCHTSFKTKEECILWCKEKLIKYNATKKLERFLAEIQTYSKPVKVTKIGPKHFELQLV